MTKSEINLSSVDELEARLDDLNGNGVDTFPGEYWYIETEIQARKQLVSDANKRAGSCGCQVNLEGQPVRRFCNLHGKS